MATATRKRVSKETKSRELHIVVLACPVCKRWHVFAESSIELISMNPEREIVCELFCSRPEHTFKTGEATIVSEKTIPLEPIKKLTEEEIEKLRS